MRGVCAVSSDKGPCACHASRTLHRACGQGAVLSLCMVRPGSGRFAWGGVLGGIRDSGWDCARGIFPPKECSPCPDPLNY